MYLHVHVCMSEGALKYQERVWDPLKLELQVAVNSPLWVLRPELRPSARVVRALTVGSSFQLKNFEKGFPC